MLWGFAARIMHLHLLIETGNAAPAPKFSKPTMSRKKSAEAAAILRARLASGAFREFSSGCKVASYTKNASSTTKTLRRESITR